MKILTIYDGTLQSKTSLSYGLREAKAKEGELVVVQAFQSSLFVDYDAGPRAEEIARAEAARNLRDAEKIIHAAGSSGAAVRVVSAEGDTVEEALRVASAEQVDLILTTPRYKAIIKKTSISVRLIPGTILVPLDNSDSLPVDIEKIIEEAKSTNSKVLLLGIIPVHLYSAEEKQELEKVKAGTTAAMKKIKNAIKEIGLEVSEEVRSGYPDEEILAAAEECAASLIMLPAGGKTPSELTKAAAILLDEPERVKRPIALLHPAEA